MHKLRVFYYRDGLRILGRMGIEKRRLCFFTWIQGFCTVCGGTTQCRVAARVLRRVRWASFRSPCHHRTRSWHELLMTWTARDLNCFAACTAGPQLFLKQEDSSMFMIQYYLLWCLVYILPGQLTIMFLSQGLINLPITKLYSLLQCCKASWSRPFFGVHCCRSLSRNLTAAPDPPKRIKQTKRILYVNLANLQPNSVIKLCFFSFFQYLRSLYMLNKIANTCFETYSIFLFSFMSLLHQEPEPGDVQKVFYSII